MKTRQDNDVTDGTGTMYTKNETKLPLTNRIEYDLWWKLDNVVTISLNMHFIRDNQASIKAIKDSVQNF